VMIRRQPDRQPCAPHAPAAQRSAFVNAAAGWPSAIWSRLACPFRLSACGDRGHGLDADTVGRVWSAVEGSTSCTPTASNCEDGFTVRA